MFVSPPPKFLLDKKVEKKVNINRNPNNILKPKLEIVTLGHIGSFIPVRQ